MTFITRKTFTVLNLASATRTASGDTGPISVPTLTELAIDINVTALSGTSPSLVVNVERRGADGVWYAAYLGAAITAVGQQSASLGPGLSTNRCFGDTIRVVWTITGTTPSFTFSVSVVGK